MCKELFAADAKISRCAHRMNKRLIESGERRDKVYESVFFRFPSRLTLISNPHFEFLRAQVIVSLDETTFGEWEEMGFAPEAELLKRLNEIDGVSSVETQTYTLMSMMEKDHM